MRVGIDFLDSGACRHGCISSLPRLPSQHDRFFARIGATMVHSRLRIHENGSKAIPDTPWPDDFDLVTSGVECLDYCRREAGLDLQTIRIDSVGPGGLGEARAAEPRRLDCLLHI